MENLISLTFYLNKRVGGTFRMYCLQPVLNSLVSVMYLHIFVYSTNCSLAIHLSPNECFGQHCFLRHSQSEESSSTYISSKATAIK